MKQTTKVAKKRSVASAKSRSRTGGAVANFLKEDGVLEDAEAVALKRVLAWELEESMRADGISKQTLASRMCTSRSQLDRLLDPKNARVQLDTVARAARALGKRLEVRIVASTRATSRQASLAAGKPPKGGKRAD
jgi:antitoxin HicB